MAVQVKMPKLGLNMTEGVIESILKKVGDTVAADEVVVTIETDKATSDIVTPEAGTILAIYCSEGEEVPINMPIFAVGKAGEIVEAPAANVPQKQESVFTASASAASESVKKPEGSRIFCSPLAKKMAKEKGIDLSTLAGSGPNGRIVKKDIENAKAVPAVSLAAAAPAFADDSSIAVLERIPLTGIRSAIAKKMTTCLQNVPQFHLTVCVDMTEAKALRARIQARGTKMGYNELLMKACSIAIKNNPMINASIIENEIVQYKDVNIGIAVAAKDGLVVPVFMHVERKSLAALAQETSKVFVSAREGKIPVENSVNGTFTISNLGMFGIDEFDAIINYPEAAILAVGAMTDTPVVIDGKVEIHPVMKITGTFDHRIIDGAVGAKFMKEVKVLLEDPMAILIN